jgi:hypothetical protein
MALTDFQRRVCRLLADNRVRSGELLHAPRLSRDLDLFHDTERALAASWSADRGRLETNGYTVAVVRERPTFVEAEVGHGGEAVIVEWVRDSAYRFFPLVQHEDLGLVLHPFDLATSKVLALVGRVEPRDFVDTLTCDREVQPFGLLAWAACGKDPGYSPLAILEHAARSTRYSATELSGLEFDGAAPDAADLSRRWHAILGVAREAVALLPAREAGKAAMLEDGGLFRGDTRALQDALREDRLVYREGSIGGVFPRIRASR